MKKTLLSIMAVAAMCGMAPNANANIDNPAGAKAGEIYRWESNNPGEFEQKCNVDDGIIGLFTYAADGADWDSQFFIVFADAVVPAGTEVEISFQYRKSEDSGVVKFNAQGHADPHSYVNNDGFDPLECTTAWQDFSKTITTTGEIRTLALNCSMGREDGTLYLRNIKVVANFEDVIDMESNADEAEIGERPSVTPPAPAEFAAPENVLTWDKLGGNNENKGIFRGKDGRFDGAIFEATTVKYGDDDVYGFCIDTAKSHNAWDAQFFVMFESVSPTAKKAMVLSLEFSTNYAGTGAFNVHNGANKNAKWSFATPDSAQWTKFTDTLFVEDIEKDSLTCWEFHIGAQKQGIHNTANYNVFFRNVKLEVDPAGVEKPEVKPEPPVSVSEAAAINVYVAGDVLFASEAADVTIFNINGVAVKAAKNVTSLNVSDLRSGLYIAKVGNKTVKFVK